MKITIACLAFFAAITAGNSLHAQRPEQESACPAEAAHARQSLARFLARPGGHNERERMKLGPVRVSAARLVTADDGQACARLNAMFAGGVFGQAPYRRTYYRAREFYFVVITQERVPGRSFRMANRPAVIVLNSALEPLNLSAGPPRT